MNRFLLAVSMALACGAQAADLDFLARHAKIDAPLSILYLGDSLTDFDRGSNHVDKLQFYLNKYNPGKVTIRNYAVGGGTVASLLANLGVAAAGRPDKSAARYDGIWDCAYDHAFVFLGHNDSKVTSASGYTEMFVPEAKQEKLFHELIGLLKSKGIGRITLVSASSSDEEVRRRHAEKKAAQGVPHNLFAVPKYLEKFNRMLRAKTAQYDNVDYLDLYSPMRELPNKSALFRPNDGVHLNQLGHEFVAAQEILYFTPKEFRWANPVGPGELRLHATYASASVVFGASQPVEGLRAEYRAKGERAWTRALPPVWFKETENYRGSVLGLKEDTDYEIRLVGGGKTLAAGTIRTWKTEVKVARTVEIDPATVKFPYVIGEKGRSDGWIRYAVKGGQVLTNATLASTIVCSGAEYVLLEGISFEGGLEQSPLCILADSRNVRVRNCVFAHWGVKGVPRFDHRCRGSIWEGAWDEKRKRYDKHNHSGAIDVDEARDVTIERCWTHDPRTRAQSWRYSHPYGPMAVRLFAKSRGVVIRYNDFAGSDDHRWDDAVGGINNRAYWGGWDRDGDLEGNFLAFSNDDGAEFDGGQENLRAFGNRFEEGMMGLSLQFNHKSPSYVVDNAFTGLGTEHEIFGASIKLNTLDPDKRGSASFIVGNVFARPEDPPYYLEKARTARLFVTNNIFAKDTVIKCAAYPKRPMPYVLDTDRIDGFEGAFTLTCGGSGYAQPFAVAKDDTCGWFAVSPAAGTVRSGETIAFTVKVDRAKAAALKRRHLRAAFFVRTADGFSRPVTIHALTDWVQPVRCETSADFAAYGKPGAEFAFEIPKKGRYYVFGRGTCAAGRSARLETYLTLDGQRREAFFGVQPDPTWVFAGYGDYFELELEPGRHTLSVEMRDHSRGRGALTDLVVTDNPLAFDPIRHADADPAAFKPSPDDVARKIIGQFLGSQPCGYFPKGAGWARPGWTNHVHYSIVSLWANAIECARAMGDRNLERQLTDRFLPWFGEKKHLQNLENHVDYCVFGALPYEVYLSTGDKRALELGASYADRQWTLPPKDAPIHCQNLPYEEQTTLLAKGYTPQTRYWIDDMYMIIFLQVQAYRATKDMKYLDRTAKEMVLYLDKLQKPDGLFDHAPDVPFVWGRGAGWMAGGMPLLLKYLPKANPDRPRILAGYRKMMAALLKWQRPNGLWGQLVTDPGSWDETSGSAMFAYGFVMGVKYGWLDKATYEPAARKAWAALCGKLDAYGNLADVCCGTAKKNDRAWYMERPRILGDTHGQAPMLWLCSELVDITGRPTSD